jgi:hypothetical protein
MCTLWYEVSETPLALLSVRLWHSNLYKSGVEQEMRETAETPHMTKSWASTFQQHSPIVHGPHMTVILTW